MSILILRNNQQTGPYPEEQARQLLASGQVSGTDLAWRNGMAEWKPLSEVLAVLSAGPAYAGAAAAATAGTMSSVKMAVLAGGAAVLLGLGGVGVWQHNEQEKIRAEQQQLALERQRMADEQQRLAEQRQKEEELRRHEEAKHQAEEERQRLAEEKRQLDARNQELEQKLRAERAEKERQRREYAAQQQRQQRPAGTLGHVPPDAMTNSYPGSNTPPQPQFCRECGIVQSVRAIATQGEASGGGALLGGVVGGALGNQVGRGRGRDAATIIGALGGAVAGNQIERSQRTRNIYETTIRFEDGMVRTFTQENPPSWQQGQRVRLMNGSLMPY